MECMTMAGYIGYCPGNHEFDLGADVYAEALQYAGFVAVAANMEFKNEYLDKRIKDYYRLLADEYTIHIFGLMTPDFERVTNGKGVEVNPDFIDVARKQVNIAKREKCDMIIAITHIGADLDRKLARVVPEIDVIVGGHSHEFVYEKVGETIIIQAGAGGSHIGVLRFDFDGKRISNDSWETVLLDSTIGADPEIDSVVSYYMSALQESLGQKIGSTEVELDARKSTVRGGESALGNLVTDSWLAWFEDADIAVINGGSIRGDRIYPAGNLNYLDITSILPFRGEIIEAKISGELIEQMLELSASALRVEGDNCPDTCRVAYGGFLQVAGIRFDIDLSRPPYQAVYDNRTASSIVDSGDRVSNVHVKANDDWISIYPEREYKVLINNWLASGGDGYYVFVDEAIEKKPTTVYTTDVLVDYIKNNSPISPEVEGRINIVK